MGLRFREATRVYAKTLPYVLLQFGIGIAFGLLGVVYLSLVGWLGFRFFAGGGGASLLVVAGVLVLGLVTFAAVWRSLQRYVLYLVTTGHVAVIAHVVDEGEAPENQISYGMTQVTEYFASASGLFVVNDLIDVVLKQFNRAVARVRDLIPVPIPQRLQTLLEVLQKSIVLAVRYLDNAIIAYMFVDRDDNRWRSARDGLVLYAKNWKPVLGSTLLMVLGMYALSFVLLTLLAPIAAVLDVLPTGLEAVSWLLIAGVVAIVHTGVVKPWVKTVVITTFLVEGREDRPDDDTQEWIAEHSDRFPDIVEKAEANEPIDESHPQTGGTSKAAGETGSGSA